MTDSSARSSSLQLDPSRVLIVIPSRFASSRFPGKPLADLCGAPLIARVVENSRQISRAATVIVATDDVRIFDAVTAVGGRAEMTGVHATGTDRLGEVAARHDADLIVNLQGDEPLLNPQDVQDLIRLMSREADVDIGTCAHAFADEEQWLDQHAVKVVCDLEGRALYFSRAPVPAVFPGSRSQPWQLALRHVGVYAFRPRALTQFLDWARSPLEMVEGLEQLRALEHGLRIQVQRIERAPVGVDTPGDLERVRELWRRGHKAIDS